MNGNLVNIFIFRVRESRQQAENVLRKNQQQKEEGENKKMKQNMRKQLRIPGGAETFSVMTEFPLRIEL